MSQKLTILATPVSAVGHVNACAGALRCLLPRGHRVIFVLDEVFEGKLAAQGYEEYIYRPVKVPTNRNAGDAFAKMLLESRVLGDSTPSEKLENLAKLMHTEKVYQDIAYVDKIVKGAIELYKPNVIYYDGSLFLPSIYNSGIPWMVNHSAQPLCHLLDDRVPPGCFGLPTDGDPKEYNKYRHWLDHFEYGKKFNDFLESIDYPRYPNGLTMPEGQMLTVYGYPEELNYPAAREHDWFNLEVFNKIEGQKVVQLNKLVSREFLSDTLDGQFSGKLIYVSMGSMGSIDLELMNRLVDILGQTNHKFIVSKGLRHTEYKLARNMYGDRFLPQNQILFHVDLVITHGGNNTVTEVFAGGKPMIVLPLFGDQFDNAQRLDETGYGLWMDTYKFENHQLINGIDKLLNDQELASKLNKASQRIATTRRHEELASKIEQLLIKN